MLAVLLIFGTVFYLTRNRKENKLAETELITSEFERDVSIEDPEDNSESEESKPIGEIEDDGNALKPDESIDDSLNKTPGVEAEANDTPKQEISTPTKEPENNAGGGIQIGGNPPVEEEYKCGSANHHCQSAGFHASLLNRELEVCPYCSSHSCPSFYAVNEWGYTCYDATLCPKYNVQQDPAKVCSDCGRAKWSSDNPTGCFRYLQETQCECGELVPGNTCHHH